MHHQVKHYLIAGLVQGVSYRISSQKKALELGLTGWVRNLGDSRVELVASGTPEQLTALETWLWQGPSRAKVTHVDATVVSLELPGGFAVAETADHSMPLLAP